MKIAAVILFALAALGGLTLAVRHFQKKSLPTGLVTAHGVLAASGLVVLILAAVFGSSVTWPLILFIVAALGGFFLLSYWLRSRALPSAVIVVHAVVAVVAFVWLLTLL